MKFKKPKFWDLKKPNFISLILLPFTLPIIINNFFLKFKSNKKNKKIKSICLGNIYLGGTGKTPTTIKLYEILKSLNLNVATAKKFYASQIDENIILDEKTKLITAKNRKIILQKAIEFSCDVVVFDDGLQDKNLSYDIEFVCFDSDKLIGNGCLIPSGPLREKINSLKKYDGIFLKSDHKTQVDHLKLFKKYNSKIQIFETYLEIKNLDNFDKSANYLIFSGIGNSQSFKNILLKNEFNIKEELIFPDHHIYKKNELDEIVLKAKNLNTKIITTKKDFVKIKKLGFDNINYAEVELKIRDEKRLVNFLKMRIYE